MTLVLKELIHEGNGSDIQEYTCTSEQFNTDLKKYNTWNGFNYSSEGFTLRIKRQYRKHIMNYYLPSTLIIMLSWVSFVIPPEVIPGRMGLLVTLVLVLVNLFGTVIANRPPTSQLTMLDIWILVCLFFAWDAFLAYAALLLHQRFQIGKTLDVEKIKPAITQGSTKASNGMDEGEPCDYNGWDRNFLIGFPLAFLACNLVYWPVVFCRR